MYPWNILCIDEVGDKKVIKKAYAKLIRKYRPDEAPEKFQEINQAYQYALKLIAQQPKTAKLDQLINKASPELEKNEETKGSVPSDNIKTKKDGIEVSNEVGDSEDLQLDIEAEVLEQNLIEPEPIVPDEEQIIDEVEVEIGVNESGEKYQTTDSLDQLDCTDIDIEQKLIDELFEQTHQMVFNTIHEKLEKENWAFLSDFHNIHDFEVKDQVSKNMFKQVAKYNFFQLKQNKILLIPPEVVVYFDEVFNWSAYWQEYERTIEPVYCDHMLGLIQPDPVNKTHKSVAGLFDRLFAFGIDASLSLFFTMLVAGSFSLQNYSEIIGFLSFGLNQIMGQMTGVSQSIGQKAHDIQVYDHFLNRPSVEKILIRNALFCMTLLSYFYIVFLPFGSVFQFVLAITMVIADVCAFVFKKQSLHEWLSQTVLVK